MQSQLYPDGGYLSMIFSSNYEPAGRCYRFLISRSVLYPLYSAYHAPKPPSSESEESVTVRAGAREMVRGDETTPLEHYDLIDKIDNDRDDEDSTYVFPPISQEVSPVHAIGEDEPEIQWATCAGVVHPGANGQEDSRNRLEDEANLH
jgi:hypothetical protein